MLNVTLQKEGFLSSMLNDTLLLLLLLPLLQVTSIHIPSVRELPSEEWAARQAAATSWRAAVKAHGQRQGLAKPPPEVNCECLISVFLLMSNICCATHVHAYAIVGCFLSVKCTVVCSYLLPRRAA
jgi:hypothetical protein